jgi:hypothetical protein
MRLRIYEPENQTVEETETLVGREFDWLTVEAKLPPINYHKMWFVRCICGRTKAVRQSNLLRKESRSCGRCARFIHTHPKGKNHEEQGPTESAYQ